MPVCRIVKLLPLGTVIDLMHYCKWPLASCNSASMDQYIMLTECIKINSMSQLVLFDYWIFHNRSSKIIGQEVLIDDRL